MEGKNWHAPQAACVLAFFPSSWAASRSLEERRPNGSKPRATYQKCLLSELGPAQQNYLMGMRKPIFGHRGGTSPRPPGGNGERHHEMGAWAAAIILEVVLAKHPSPLAWLCYPLRGLAFVTSGQPHTRGDMTRTGDPGAPRPRQHEGLLLPSLGGVTPPNRHTPAEQALRHICGETTLCGGRACALCGGWAWLEPRPTLAEFWQVLVGVGEVCPLFLGILRSARLVVMEPLVALSPSRRW